jgi:hypothetical protein
MSIEGNNKLFLVNTGIKEYLRLDKKCMLRRINLGVRAFQRCKNKHNGDKIIFRITQEGLQSLFHSFTKRKIRISIKALMWLVHNQNSKHADVPESETEIRTIIGDPELGYFALYVEEDGRILEMACLLKFGSSVNLMASDEQIQGLKIKYEVDFLDVPTKPHQNRTAVVKPVTEA